MIFFSGVMVGVFVVWPVLIAVFLLMCWLFDTREEDTETDQNHQIKLLHLPKDWNDALNGDNCVPREVD